ncbi:XamI family restriction endonuclease [Arcanobacterium buesumense]|uniref:XamI family restriction endonuclease n=1 Tax=Arcanobacterium buesumense TaxID=2722751 RepID=A0A6H2ELJ1_9ACTO|nr:XamI family restriction endonuclease [Arcanobacterium buesumense]
MPINLVVQLRIQRTSGFSVPIGAKSARDFTNPNKRLREEATKVHQLKYTCGEELDLLLHGLLNG